MEITINVETLQKLVADHINKTLNQAVDPKDVTFDYYSDFDTRECVGMKVKLEQP